VPVGLKIRNGRRKHLLRRVLERHVPRPILERGKQGFAAPIGDWLRGPLAGMTQDLLLDGRLAGRGLFDMRHVASLWTDHRSGRAAHPHRLWQLLMLELWFRTFIDGDTAVSRPAPAVTLAEAV
jgi:asparagine synthase (glutamine-hydrolysing)